MARIFSSGVVAEAVSAATFCLISGETSRRPRVSPACQIPCHPSFESPCSATHPRESWTKPFVPQHLARAAFLSRFYRRNIFDHPLPLVISYRGWRNFSVIHPRCFVFPSRRKLQSVSRFHGGNGLLEQPFVLQNVGPQILLDFVAHNVSHVSRGNLQDLKRARR